MTRAKHYRNPALESEHQPHKPYDQVDAGHLIMPNGSILSSNDHTFMTACAPHVLALHMAERGSSGE